MSHKQHIPINKGNYSMEGPEREERFEAARGDGWEKEYREYRDSWTRLPLAQEVADYPLLVDAELSSACNLKCPMCYTITDEFKSKVAVQMMKFDLFKKIVDEIAGKVPALRISFRGEATLHPKFLECLRYAKDSGIREVSFLTNGSRMKPDFFQELVAAGADWITLSIDGTGAMYESIRAPIKFAEILENVANAAAIKRERGLKKPVLKVQSVWPAISEDPQGFYNTFAPLVDMVAFNPLIDYLGKDELTPYVEGFSCPQLYQRLVIGSDGKAMMCSNDEEGSISVGDANAQSVHEIWHGEELNAIRAQHKRLDGFKEFAPCRKCYLPRSIREDEKAVVDGRTITIKNYVNRSQTIGT
ncbi:MAG: radical SAM protein [Elusimicrobia bacterium CG_4_9_14_3_um_filter_62_55]|nr:MAG: radical SAM protein [Elusimicrobia bacterium CG22_combo_CG10-13_8_21_14_all_63_91]PJB24380.1 MAG: radical SAM protein [Elusimicrobia bacterium CG_4_9_14_3_um_filter_62_55]